MRDDFAAFILTHGRPAKVVTLTHLRSRGYTGQVFIVIDDQDPTGDEYRERFGDSVLTFSKDEIGATFDKYDMSTDQRGIVWARNACWELARNAGVRYFIQLDDDYTAFQYRRPGIKPGAALSGYHGWQIKSLDAVLEAMVQFIEDTPAMTLCMSQGGDHMGGAESPNAKQARLRRKAMNSFVCDVQRPFTFVGRINEDVNTYVSLGSTGHLFYSYMPLQLEQIPTQHNQGGMTDLYLDCGTYVKSFFTVITSPSCVKVTTMGRTSPRLHHQVSWRYAVPKVVSERHKVH